MQLLRSCSPFDIKVGVLYRPTLSDIWFSSPVHKEAMKKTKIAMSVLKGYFLFNKKKTVLHSNCFWR